MGNFDRRSISPLFKMETTIWLSLVLVLVTLALPVSPSEPRVVCYYTNWSVYRPGTARFNPQNINPYLCTHLIYAFGGFTKDNTLKPFDKYQDIEKGGYAKFTGLKTYNKQLKTMLAIGGWNEGSSRFSPMVAAKDRRKEFVRNAIKFLRQNHFDGLDLDWEYPAFRDGGKPKDRENYARLVKELREEFERESQKTGKPRLLLTMAVPAGIEYIQKGFDVKTLNRYLDWMNLLTYDYHSAFEPAVNHHAPLFPLEEPNEYSVDNELNIDHTIKFYLENGADREKLVLGIPTYGRSYTLFNPDAFEIGAPADGPGDQGDATREKGYLAYYEICEALKPKTSKKKRQISSDEESDEEESEEEEEEDLEWTVMHPNPDAMGPVAYRGNQWVGYDDIDIVKKKADYVAENGLGGIMFWSIDNDDFRGTCHGKPYPLIEAAKEAYIVKLGSTDNTIVTDKPKTAVNRRTRPRKPAAITTTTQAPAVKEKSHKRKSGTTVVSTTPSWSANTPEPPTTPDPGSDFKCTDEGFFQHPRDCKKYFWCLDSGPSNLGIVAHQFTCPSGLFFNKAADSCDFARNVLCKKPAAETTTTSKPTTTRAPTTTTTTRRPVKLSTKSSVAFRTTTTTTTTPEPEVSEEDVLDDIAEVEAEDPKVIKELIELIKKVGGVEQLEKQLHLAEGQASTDGAQTTTPASFNKKLYQKVLERTRKNKFGVISPNEGNSQNSRRGPQNAGLEASDDKDRLLKKDRPQYTTINRSRSRVSTTEEPLESEEEDEPETDTAQSRLRSLETEVKSTTGKPLQYVNIRRARPTVSTSDTADDTASRNALFERSETFVAISEAPNSLDVANAKRESIPEYVTIRRQRLTTEESTTAQYQESEEETELQETALEREISSPPLQQPQYTSILRTRSTTLAPSEEPSSPEPTTVLAVQISSLLNSPSSTEVETPDTETAEVTESTQPATTTTSTTTTNTAAPATRAPPRRAVLRRRGSTSTTTSTATPTTVTQTIKDRRNNFLRRTKATAPPDTTDTESTTIDTTTSKYTRRGQSKFKSRTKVAAEKIGAENELEKRRPSLNVGVRSERPTRTFVRRRLGGANATTASTAPSTASVPASAASDSPSASASSVSSASTRRPFRVASRRRLVTTTTTSTTTTASPTTTHLASDESLQEIDIDSIEDPNLTARVVPKKTVKVQRRPLVTLKEEEVVDKKRPRLIPFGDEVADQNPSATNEEERKRQSKKYSASFKQNQLDEKLRQKAKSQEEMDTTTEGKITTVEVYDSETALALAAHQLLAAPLPSVSDYDETTTSPRKSSTTQAYKYTDTTNTDSFTDTRTPIYSEDFTSTSYRTSTNPDYVQTSTGNSFNLLSSPKTSTINIPTAFTTSGYTKPRLTTPELSPTIISSGLSGVSSNLNPSTARYIGSTEKYLSVPVEDFAYSTGGYGSTAQEPAYFTREYLLESPVTRTYDDEYQYLSPVTTPVTTTRKVPKKTVYRRISTTIRPTTPAYVPPSSPSTIKPRRVPTKKPFEKTPVKKEPAKTYQPIENYDYYDDLNEKLVEKYAEGTKVVLHGKGTIECLDIGNFPHPSSCKKFISCARMESGAILGWEYVCPKGLSFDPVGGICNWSAGLGCDE